MICDAVFNCVKYIEIRNERLANDNIHGEESVTIILGASTTRLQIVLL